MSDKTDVSAALSSPQADLPPPVAAIHPVKHRNHGDARVDHYYWLRERDNPAVLAYLEAENKIYRSNAGPHRGIAKRPL